MKIKTTILFLFIFLISLSSFSQSLEGEWKGNFIASSGSAPSIMGGMFMPQGGYVDLKFILNEDSSYTVYSTYKGSDTLNVCEVIYKRISRDSIYLEETKIIKPGYRQGPRCFQKMYLKIHQRKKSMELIGSFNFVSGGVCDPKMQPETSFGDIRFYKKTEEK